MPWNAQDVDKHRKNLTDTQKKRWVATANSALASCQKQGKSGCEASAIRVANSLFESLDIELDKIMLDRDNKIKESILKECSDISPVYSNYMDFYNEYNLNVEIGNPDSLFVSPFVKVNGIIFCLESLMRGFLPFYSNSVSSMKVFNFLEYFPPDRFKWFMEEAYCALEHGGRLEIRVPSTDGKNAFANPNYRSYFNELSFSYFTDEELQLKFGTKAFFDIESIKVTKDSDNIIFIDCVLTANKPNKDEMMH